ncbi:phosphatidylserine/phosphatidylglycerophosphate/cardiolipin synthase-like enzyme [Nocardiopsis mwathae]|uniref:Phosphatidylserine/phosphatidylglycerophosphate/ cardiolipin synthase-like enzyme n=1 Tax=Nocardiopsis mwathae TaxID=1472723 RepID=A0A7W9YJ14_9ACTN|nr:DISARM system phospholipase D-like protein DrmC [Nocardiopsis mwathae]MBB6172987.1 phosphatidylserine/phosphatidylglycerophosphate/cardiolipin synthase-like enzyme [Nocardiopsis mwathae]
MPAALAEVAQELAPGHAAAWARVLEEASGPSAAGLTAHLLASRPGYGLAPLADRLVAAWAGSPDTPGSAVALALLAASHVSERTADRRGDVVITGPSVADVPTRLTSAVVAEVIGKAERELLIVSYAAYRADGVMDALAAAAGRGVRINVVLEDATGAVDAFARVAGLADFWRWPREHRGADGRASLHAKVIAADHRVALIGSANLTGHAMNENIEVGVLVHDPDTVRRIVGHFRALMRGDARMLVPAAGA